MCVEIRKGQSRSDSNSPVDCCGAWVHVGGAMHRRANLNTSTKEAASVGECPCIALLKGHIFPSFSRRDRIEPEVRLKCAQSSCFFMPSSNRRHSSLSNSSVHGFPLFSGRGFLRRRDSSSTAQCSARTISTLLQTWSSGSTSPVKGSTPSAKTSSSSFAR